MPQQARAAVLLARRACSCGEALAFFYRFILSTACVTGCPPAAPPARGPGWADCDGNVTNGCETQTTTASHCGACGRSCVSARPVCKVPALPGKAAACVAKVCPKVRVGGEGASGGAAAGSRGLGAQRALHAAGQLLRALPTLLPWPTPAALLQGQTRCKGKCVNLKTDPSHCNACGHACRVPKGYAAGERSPAGPCWMGCAGCSSMRLPHVCPVAHRPRPSPRSRQPHVPPASAARKRRRPAAPATACAGASASTS